MWTPNTYTPARGPQTTNLYDSAFFVLSPKVLVYTCFAAHVSSHMACGNLAAHTALQTHGFSMEVSHYTHRCFREHESGALQIQWSESNMPFAITNTVVGEQHDQKHGYL